jgi:uncharacterized protein YndB with AHSA1/START domain
MTQAAARLETKAIVIEEIFPHSPETLWRVLTSGALIERWMPMRPTGFAPVAGTRFTYHTTPAGAWDGTIHCEVLESITNECLAYSWRGGDEGNLGYGAPLDTVVTFTLQPVADGTRLRMTHSGFVLPRNELALKNMGGGWQKIVARIGELAGEPAA